MGIVVPKTFSAYKYNKIIGSIYSSVIKKMHSPKTSQYSDSSYGATIDQSVQGLTTGRMVGGLNPGGEGDFLLSITIWNGSGAHPATPTTFTGALSYR